MNQAGEDENDVDINWEEDDMMGDGSAENEDLEIDIADLEDGEGSKEDGPAKKKAKKEGGCGLQ